MEFKIEKMDYILIIIEIVLVFLYNIIMKNIKKKSGFQNEKIFIIPENIIKKTSDHPLLKSLYVTDIGYFPHAQYHYRKRKEGSKQYILIYCSKGKGIITINGQKRNMEENTLLIIPPFLAHIYSSDNKEPWYIYWCHFNGQTAGHYLNPNNKDSLTISSIAVNKLPLITGFFDSIFNVLNSGYSINNLIYSAQAFNHILATIFFKETGQEDQNYINETISYMKENLNKKISLDKLASQNNLSKSQFNKLFKEKTGFSPIDYFIRLKIQQACKYLDLTDLQIKEIATRLAYNDPYYFSRVFKKIMGISPRTYRNIKKG